MKHPESKYDEYKRHSQKLMRIMGILQSQHVTVDTVDLVPFMPESKRLCFRKVATNQWEITVID